MKVGPIRSDGGGAMEERRCSGPIRGPLRPCRTRKGRDSSAGAARIA